MLNLGLLLVFQTGEADEKLHKWSCVKKTSLGFEDKKTSLFPSPFLSATNTLKLFSKSE